MRLPSNCWAPLGAAGGRAAYFGRIRLAPLVRRRDHVNFRNHRKIIIVDGLVGLTGGINIGREYLGLDPAIGAWRDTHLRIEGPATLGLQQTFVEDWLVTTGELLDGAPYFPEPTPVPVTRETERPRAEHSEWEAAPDVRPLAAATAEPPGGDTIVQCVASGPDRPWAVIHQMYALGIAYAERRVWATSPYFVPDRVMQMALVTAALRGVDVRLLVPKRSDSRLVDLASRYYFPELLEAGVRIFEYGAGFLHAKSLVVDDWLAAIGSSNMDIRSFQLNYELSAFVYDRRVTEVLASQFEADLARAHEVPKGWAKRLSYGRRLLHAAAGLLSPLL
jgi:cardiolipin synthase